MMNEEKSREELLAELAEMHRCLDGLTASEADLKLLQEETLLLEKDKVPEISGGKERILLVEDERDVRTIAFMILEGKGYKLLTASNYEEAVTVFQQEKGEIDLLFTDIMLPDRSGLELAKELKLRKPDLMVLLTSGYSSEHLQIQNLLLDDYRLLEKPYTMEQLLHTIREMTNVKKLTA